MAVRVTDPSGQRWLVRRRWLPVGTILLTRTFGRRLLRALGVIRDLTFGGLQALPELLDRSGGMGYLMVVGVLALPIVLGLGALFALVDLVPIVLLGTPLLVRRAVLGRPWRFEAVGEAGDAFAVEAPGWRSLDAIVESIRTGQPLPDPQAVR